MNILKELLADPDIVRRMAECSLKCAPVNATDIVYEGIMDIWTKKQINKDNSETSAGMDFGLDDEFVSIDRAIDELAAEMVDVDGSEEASEEPPSELDRQIAANILKRQKKRSRPSLLRWHAASSF